MRLYDSLEMFDTGLSHVRKWMRCGQAIRQSTVCRWTPRIRSAIR